MGGRNGCPTKECVNGWVSVQDFSLQLEFLGALSTTQFVEQFFEVRSCCIFVSYFSRDVDLQNLICNWVICSLIGPEDSLYSHNQWSQKLKPTIWYSRFSPPQTFSHFLVFSSSQVIAGCLRNFPFLGLEVVITLVLVYSNYDGSWLVMDSRKLIASNLVVLVVK